MASTFEDELNKGVLVDAVNWCRYSNGKPIPTQNTRSLVEKKYPGTFDIFEHGPEFFFVECHE